MQMKKDIYYKYLQNQLKIVQPYSLKLFNVWEHADLGQETLKRFSNLSRENKKNVEHYNIKVNIKINIKKIKIRTKLSRTSAVAKMRPVGLIRVKSRSRLNRCYVGQ